MGCHLAGGSRAAVELLGDPSGAVGVAGEQHDRSVVLGLGAEMDLRHRLLQVGFVTRTVGGGPFGPARLRVARFYVLAGRRRAFRCELRPGKPATK